jgi:hypothetical protein
MKRQAFLFATLGIFPLISSFTVFDEKNMKLAEPKDEGLPSFYSQNIKGYFICQVIELGVGLKN